MNLDLEILNNPYVVAVLAICVAAYGSHARMDIPDFIRNLFKNEIFRVVFLSLLLVYNFNKTPHVAICVALVFVFTMDYLNQQEIQENFVYIDAFRNTRG